MAHFMDAEAVESEDEDMDEDDRRLTQKKKKSALDSSDEEEDEDEEKAREEMGDFITDEVEASGSDSGSASGSGSGSESGGGRKRKKKRRKRSRSRSRSRSSDRSDLDEDDMDLIEENLGVKIKKKHRRIQKMDSDESEDDASRAGSVASGSELPDPERGGDSREGSDDEDINDFIVDEEGRPIQRSQKKKKKHIFDDSARQMAEDIFGVAFDYDEFEQYDKSGDESERSEESYDEDGEEIPEEEKRRKKEMKKKRKPAKTIFDIFDPDDLEKGHYTDQDQEIRNTDIPERMQLRQVPVTAVPEDSDELDREAEWIFKFGFIRPTLTQQTGYTKNDCHIWQNKTDTVGKIKKALDFMRQQFLEVPFIAFYRKEYVNPELEIDDLWRVYFMDEKWCQLQARKRNVRRLFDKMQNYQGDTLMANPDAPLPEGMKVLDQEDIDRLEGVETVEELKDIYQHFMLYQNKDLANAQEHHRKKIREEKEERKARKRAAREKKFKTILKRVTKTRINKVPTGNMITVTKKRTVMETVTETVMETITNDDGEEEEIEKEIEKEVAKEIEEEVEEEEMEDEEEEFEEEVEEEVTDDEAMDEDDPDDEEDEEEEEEQEITKYASRNDAYSLCTKYKLGEMAARFGLTAEQFGENLRDGYQRNEPEQDTSDPAEVATEYIGEKLTSTEEIIKAAKFMVATQISKDPLVRATARDVFHEKAVITVNPTKLGIEEIGEDHPCFTMKYLKDKPIREFRGDEFAKLQIAEKDKLVEMKVAENISGMNPDKLFLDEAKDAYKHDGFSKTVQLWNNLRAEAVEMALEKILFPQLRKELLHKLRLEAVDGIKRSCQEKLHEWIQWAPYDVTFEDEEEDDWDSTGGCRVLGIAYENDVKEKDVDTASYAVLISQEGEVADICKLDHILKRARRRDDEFQSRFEKETFEKEKDIAKLRNFIKQKRPHVIAIAAEDRKALDIQKDVQEIVTDLVESDQFPRMEVHLVDNNLAKVYSNTNKSNVDFREYPEILKQAISIGRRIQDPLLEFSQLCGAENDILCLRYHLLQDEVPDEELLQALNLEFINLTNDVGVDINECVAHNHASNLLQFVGGLGPRKGAHLLKTLRGMTQPRLENRQQLVTSCHMGPKVFINCAGFIKIDTSSLGDSEIYVEVLDGSRIHNEAYEWARKMAVDALEYDEDEGNPASALEDILRQPDKLDELNLDAFAEELERQGFGNKSVTLYDIKAELNNMYKDHRQPFQPPNPEQTFDIITKESPNTFYIGKLLLVQCVGFAYKKPQGEELDQAAPVRKGDENLWQCPFCGQDDFPELTEVWNHFDAEKCPGKCTGVKVRLDNGVNGFIRLGNLSDSMVTNPEERVQFGQRIYIRVTKIIPEKLQVDCTSKTSDLIDEDWALKPKKDNFYDDEAEGKDKQHKEDLTKKKKQTTYIKRVIVHPAFHNISFKDAEKLMQTMDNGEVIIRPSSKGENHLTVTWKVAEGIFQHIDVREEGKENAFSLGTSLWIVSEEFEDLDEIIARHINPMASHMRDLLNFKNYREFIDGNRQKAEDALKAEKKAVPNKIHYFMSASKEMPGKVMLSYMPRAKPRHEFVTVTPDGYRFRKRNFESLPQLMKWFKEHFRDPIPQTPGMRGGTTRTPYGGGTPGGITPGAMSMAGGETPVQGGRSYGGTVGVNAPYTPTANTPFMTPYNTPGPSMTPRHHGSTTPRPPAYPGSLTPRQHGGSTPRPPAFPGGGSTPSQPGSLTPGGGRYGGSTPGGGRYAPGGGGSTPGGGRYPPGGGGSTPGGGRYPPGGSTPGGGRYPPAGGRDSPHQGGWNRGGSNRGGGGGGRGGGPRGSGGDGWAQAAEAWASGRNNRKNPRDGGSTPRPNDPRGYSSGTPKYDDKPRTPRYESGGNSAKRTPKGQFGDATPLYDE